MARGRFLVLPSLILLLVYIRNMVAVGDGARAGLPLHGMDERDFWHGDEAIQLDVINSNHISPDSSSSEDWATEVFSTLKSAIPVTFEPSVLDFREQPTGMPALREVKIINPRNSLTLQLTSISGELSEFHTSFFKSKVLLAGESTTFDVVFLARSLSPVEDTLHIHTSLGILDYKVKAVGVSNPFKLRPLKGARIPINATYSPVITMYNPYDISLQIKEIYSSGGELHLELFTGQQEGNKALWEIRPYETKSLARLNFHAPTPTNHTAFIRIKTNHTTDPSLVLPVEVEVCEAVGLFLSRELLDFGVLKGGESKSIPLYMLNAGPHLVYLKSITPVPDNPAITIEYSNTTLKPGSKYIKVAMVTYSSDVDSPDTDMILKIWAEDRTSFHQLTIPYEATILRGSLVYEKSLTLFRVHDPPFRPIIRNVTLSNQFDFPVVIYSAKLSMKALDYYSIISFDAPYVLPPDSEWHSPIRLKFVPTSSDCLFNTSLRLSTNASYFNIPLQCYDGRLEREPVVDALEFGLLSDSDSGSKLLTVWNPNPVKVSITSVHVSEGSRLPDLSVHLVSLPPLPENNEPTNTLRKRTRKPPFYLDRGQSVVFRINVTRPKQPGKFAGELLIHSSLGKVLTVPVNYMAVTGAMHIIPEQIRFLPSFPFSSSAVTLSVRSSYTQPVQVVSLRIAPSNDSVHPVPIILPQELPTIAPNALTKIGELSFDPLLLGKDFRYTSAEVATDDEPAKGQRSLRPELDQLETLWNVWQSVIDRGAQWFNYSIVLSTEVGNGAQGYTVPVEASMEWPHIASARTVTFPLTIIGNSSHQYLQLINPSSHPLYVEPILLQHCSQPKLVLKSLTSKFSQLDPALFQPSVTAFSVVNQNDPVQESVSEYLIPPHGNVSVQLKFTPDMDQWSHGLVVLRNNLTALEYVHLMGQSNWGYVSVSGVYPVDTGTNGRSLLFDFSPALMEGCISSECGNPVHEQLSLSKIFHIYNAGSSPLTVLKSSVSGRGCEGHGFRVVNCEKPIIVYPNRTRKIEISFAPDYTLSRVTSTLRLHTSTTGILTFPLLATLPHYLLPICYNNSPHSELESLASYLSVPLWLVALTAMILATVFQVNWHARRLQRSIARMSMGSAPSPHGRDVPVQATGGATFNLQTASDVARSVQHVLSERVLTSGRRDQPSPLTQLTSDSSDSQPVPTHLDSPDHLRHRPKPSPSPQPAVSPPISTASYHDFIPRPISVPLTETSVTESSEQPLLIDRQDQAPHSFTDQRTGMLQVESSSPTQKSPRHSRTEDMSTNSSDTKSSSLAPSGKSSDNSSPVSVSSINVQSTIPAQQTRKHSKGSKKLSSTLLPSPPLRASPLPSKTDKPSIVGHSQERATSEPTRELTRETPVEEEERMEEKSDQLQRTESNLQRKESNESIKSSECSDAASTPSSSSSSGDHSADPTASEPRQSEPGGMIEVRLKVKPLSTSYTKEPWTGQTVLIREAGEEVETIKGEGENLDAASSSSAVVSKPRSKKKQRAQMKREEKIKRRQREKEELSLKKLNCSQELNGSDDKVSLTSSSASSTDYLEEDTNGDQEEKVCDEEKEDEEVEESISPTQFTDQVERTSSPESRELQDNHLPSLAQPDHISSLVNNDQTMAASSFSELLSAPVPKDAITCSALERDQLMTDVVDSDKDKDDKETQTRLTKKADSTAPTTTTIDNDPEKASGLENDGRKVKKDRVKVDTESTTPRKNFKAPEKVSQGRDSPLSPSKPGSFKKSSQQVLSPKRAQSVPSKDSAAGSTAAVAPARSKTDKLKSENLSTKGTALSKQEGQKVPRPQSLSLAEPSKTATDGPVADAPLSTELDGSEVDGEKATEVAATPHELAASLLSKLQRGKVKNDREKPNESQQSGSQATGTISHSRKSRGGAMDSQQDKNQSNLSLNAQPFVPTHYHPHNPGRPGFQLRPPYRGQLLTPPYDFYPVRPGAMYPNEDPMYQERFEQRRHQRKHDHQKYQSKPGFSASPHYLQDYRERAYMPRGGYEPHEWSGHNDSGSGLEAVDEDTAAWYHHMRQATARERLHAIPTSSARLASSPYHRDPPTSQWLTSRPRNLPIDSDPLWDQPAAGYSSPSGYRDDFFAELAETRRQKLQLQKLYAEQMDAHEQQLYARRLPSPQQDVSDLSHLREQHSSLSRAHYPLDSDESTVRQLRRLREQQQQHEQDELSLLLSKSSGTVNRAPGTTRDHSKAVGSSRLLSAVNSGRRLSDLLDDSDTVPSWMPSPIAEEQPSTTSNDTGWKAIWSLGSPFSSTTSPFDDNPPPSASKSVSSKSPEDNNTEQDASNAFTGNTYDLFDSAQNIWSLSSGDTGLFPWSSSSSKSKNDSGTA